MSERRTGCGGSGAPSIIARYHIYTTRRNGEQDAEAVELHREGSHTLNRLGVGTENRMRRQWSGDRIWCADDDAWVGTENRMRRQWSGRPCGSFATHSWSERRTGCGGSGAGVIALPWLPTHGRNGEQDAEAVERCAR